MIHIELPENFDKQLRSYLERQRAIINGDFRLVLEDTIICGLCYAEAIDRAVKAIEQAGHIVWDSEIVGHDWDIEYYVEIDKDEDLVLFATIESELEL